MTQQIHKVAFIGLGKMGSALADRVLQAGYDLTVYNRTTEKMHDLVKKGAKPAESAKDAVNNADLVLTSLLNDQAVLEVVNGENGFLPALKLNAIHLETSTILPSTAKSLAELHHQHGSMYVAGNVLGVPKAAEKGQLTAILGGNPKAIEYCTPVVMSYAQKIIRVGDEPAYANMMKICINYTLVTAIECMGEIYTYAEKSGLDTNLIQDMFHSVFAHPAFKLYVDKIKSRNFDEVNFDLAGGFKDINMFQQAFSEALVVPDIATTIRNKFIIAMAHGMQQKDWSAIADVSRLQAGLNET